MEMVETQRQGASSTDLIECIQAAPIRAENGLI
jgi:hypothetical protein